MHPLDAREQRLAYGAAGFAFVASVGLWAPLFDEVGAIVLAGAGAVSTAVLWWGARRRSRLLAGLGGVLLVFYPWRLWFLGFVFMVFTAWLYLRGVRSGGGRPRRSDDPHDSEGSSPRRSPELPRRPPGKSKRYTPPSS